MRYIKTLTTGLFVSFLALTSIACGDGDTQPTGGVGGGGGTGGSGGTTTTTDTGGGGSGGAPTTSSSSTTMTTTSGTTGDNGVLPGYVECDGDLAEVSPIYGRLQDELGNTLFEENAIALAKFPPSSPNYHHDMFEFDVLEGVGFCNRVDVEGLWWTGPCLSSPAEAPVINVISFGTGTDDDWVNGIRIIQVITDVDLLDGMCVFEGARLHVGSEGRTCVLACESSDPELSDQLNYYSDTVDPATMMPVPLECPENKSTCVFEPISESPVPGFGFPGYSWMFRNFGQPMP